MTQTVTVEGVECVEVPYNPANVEVFKKLARDLNLAGNICAFCPLNKPALSALQCSCSAMKRSNEQQSGGDVYIAAKYWPILTMRINNQEKGGPT